MSRTRLKRHKRQSEPIFSTFHCSAALPETSPAKNTTAERQRTQHLDMPFLLQGEALEKIKEILARQGGTLLGVRQVKGAKTYRVEVVADLDDGCGRRRWRFPEGIKYPRSNKGRRDFEAQKRLAKAWCPSHASSIVNSLKGTKYETEAAGEAPLPTREKRPRVCAQQTAAVVPDDAAPRGNRRGGAREGAGRTKDSYGKKRRLKFSQDSPAVAAREQRVESTPCRAVWERGLTYSKAVQKAVLAPGSAVAKAAGLDVSEVLAAVRMLCCFGVLRCRLLLILLLDCVRYVPAIADECCFHRCYSSGIHLLLKSVGADVPSAVDSAAGLRSLCSTNSR